MYKKCLIIFFLILLGTMFAGLSYAVSSEEQARICAEENFSEVLSVVKDVYNEFHFKSEKDVMNAYLGDSIPNYNVNISDFDEDKDLEDQIEQAGFYKFPVMCDGEITTDLSLALNDGEWEVVDIGGHMASTMNEIAMENDLDLKDCSILWLDDQPYLMVEKEGKLYGTVINLRQTDDDEKELLDPDDLNKQLKKDLEKYQEKMEIYNNNYSSNPEDLIVTGISTEPDYMPLIQDSVITRISRYLAHVL